MESMIKLCELVDDDVKERSLRGQKLWELFIFVRTLLYALFGMLLYP